MEVLKLKRHISMYCIVLSHWGVNG